MTIERILARIEKIKKEARNGDDESAHSLEGDLYLQFIEYVYIHSDDPELEEKAKLILTVKDIEFSRWCA